MSGHAPACQIERAARKVTAAHRAVIEAVTPGHPNGLLEKMRKGDPGAWRGHEEYDARFSQWHAATRELRRALGEDGL